MSESELIEELAVRSTQGRLVLFLGTGFSKAVLGFAPLISDHFSPHLAARVPSWVELLAMCRSELKLPRKDYQKELAIDCPSEASEIVSELSKTIGCDEAEKLFKGTIAKLIDFYPNPEQVCAYQGLMKKIRPSMIVTTNYDNVIETILHTEYYSYGAKDVVSGLPTGMTAIYHLHGDCGNPQAMVITREDYVKALNPTSYRQRKLACIMRENAIVYVGYSKSDINVLSAMEVAENAFLDLSANERQIQVQVVYDTIDIGKVSGDESLGQYSVSSNDTFAFLGRLAECCGSTYDERQKRLKHRQDQYDALLRLSDDESVAVIKNQRGQVSSVMKNLASAIARNDLDSCVAKSMLIVLVQKLYGAARGESYKNLNFGAYEECLFVLLELLANMEAFGTWSFFFNFAMEGLEDIARYIGSGHGQSWAADDLMKKTWHRIPESVISEVREYAKRHNQDGVLTLVEKMKEHYKGQAATERDFV